MSVALTWNGEQHGQVIAALDPKTEITEAWHRINALIGLAVSTVVALCLLVYFVVSHALRPTREILAGLQRLEQGELGARLPRFRLRELQKMSEGFNRLAASLEKSIARQSELARKLVDAQEQERHYVARELHDEFGQCLAAINAIAASVSQTASQEKSALVGEGEKLGRIAAHMMQALRDILNRLRPVGIEEVGLLGGIRGLVAEYGARGTQVELSADGEFSDLPDAIVVSVYRVVQECLTNVAKHSNASSVRIVLERIPGSLPGAGESISVSVEDDGDGAQAAVSPTPGRGLLGMRERVTALGGQLVLRAREAGGLNVQARIPIVAAA
jgi:glucose-6-phosphate-specific signal transduction histidine kinase